MTLFGLTKKANKKWAEMAINALKDLFLEGYLIETKSDGTEKVKLHVFTKNPIIIYKHENEISDSELTKVYFEHCVREILRDLVNVIIGKEFVHNDLEYFRTYAMNFIQDIIILSGSCDLMESAIAIVVNKLGDLSKKVQIHAI